MKIINKKIEELIPYNNNPRNNEKAVDYLVNSIKEFGFKVPIVIDKNNVIVTGHTRLKACKKLKMKEVPCIVADDLTDEQIKAYRLADNKVNELSDWDYNALDLELEEILNIDMEDFGFNIEELDSDEFGTDFELPSGDKSEFEQITFTLHKEQKALIEYAMGIVKDDIVETFGNTNKNGNAIYEVVRQWAELKKLN